MVFNDYQIVKLKRVPCTYTDQYPQRILSENKFGILKSIRIFVSILVGYRNSILNMTKKENKHIELHWQEGFKLDADEDGFRQKDWKKKYQYVAGSSTKRYYNCLYLLCKLSPCARNLMDYLSEVMDADNMISTTENDRSRFRVFIDKVTNGTVTYSDSAIKKAQQELKAKNLIISSGVSRAKVNPLYFFTGSDAKRLSMIKLTIKIGTELDDANFHWVSEELILDSKLKKHKAIADRLMAERESHI
jgi:hypothetical protein